MRDDRLGCGEDDVVRTRPLVGPLEEAGVVEVEDDVDEGVAIIISTNCSCPPEYAMMPPNGDAMSGSIGRIERTGPTTSGTSECQIATYRVSPPSTSSSKTMSVRFSAICGRASSWLSIFTASDGWARPAPRRQCRAAGRARAATGAAASTAARRSARASRTGTRIGVAPQPVTSSTETATRRALHHGTGAPRERATPCGHASQASASPGAAARPDHGRRTTNAPPASRRRVRASAQAGRTRLRLRPFEPVPTSKTTCWPSSSTL